MLIRKVHIENGFIHLRQPTVILFDEPDAHLHGSLQHALLSELQHLVATGCQILFATHSREMITRIDPSNILSIEEDGVKRLALAFDVYDTLTSSGTSGNGRKSKTISFTPRALSASCRSRKIR